MSSTSKSRKSIWDPTIVRGAAIGSVLKLNPRKMMGNPVMFVVEVGSVITTILLMILRPHESFKFNLQITLWLWFTVLFANFAEAMAEGRGKAQADTLRKARSETVANACWPGTVEQVPAPTCARRTWWWSSPESLFPATARSSTASRRSTSRRSPANRLR
jgi:potassium-transporting ATPase ATP-binding subunit